MVFARRCGLTQDGARDKNHGVPESMGFATVFLIAALHHAGLSGTQARSDKVPRPAHEKPVMILPVGWPAADATVPALAKSKADRRDPVDLPSVDF